MAPIAEIDAQLLRLLRDDDATAFRIIYENYQGKVFLFALRLTKSKTDAEEIVQEVFVKIWEKRSGIEAERNFNAYILTITRNLILDRLKKANRDKAIQQRIYQNIQALQSVGINELIEKELHRLYEQAIDRLSSRKKEIYLLSREEELSYEEIAQKLGISINTVRNQISDALHSIREYLSNHPDLACVFIAYITISKLF